MESFLSRVAQQILAEHPQNTDRVLVVFNNHRSALFLRRAFEQISAQNDSTFFLPQMTVIDDLVSLLGGLRIVPNEFLLFELFRIHSEIGGEERKYRSFEDFISFGDVMLSDFSEIDRYRVDARQIFVDLYHEKKIGEWDIENPHLTPFQQEYLRFYHSLFDYYTHLRTALSARGEAYSGMAYRHVADHISSLADRCTADDLYFIGFNALSACEEAIISEYIRRGKGHLLTDSDTYYFQDPTQEAGLFLRQHQKDFPEILPHGPSLFSVGKKKIRILNCPENILQCKYAGHLLASNPQWLSEPESTAIVLADESLLMPTLAALPPSDKPYGVNITMGYPFADSKLHTTVRRILSLFSRANPQGYYHDDVEEVLADFHIERLTLQHGLRHRASLYLRQGNRIRCSAADVSTILRSDQLSFLFPDELPSPTDALLILRHLCSLLASESTPASDHRERQALVSLAEIIEYLLSLQQQYTYISDISTLEKIYSRLALRHSIAFLGKPLSGLQVLGVLETRNLDFRRIILLSANEGVLPSGRSQNTLIPYELQRLFHLPTYEEKDAVYAYNFYRLLQRAEEVYILFSSDQTASGKGEESRFLKQLRSELSVRFPSSIDLADSTVELPPSRTRTAIRTAIEKRPTILQKLSSIAAKGFSPSALNIYIDCPLQYHYAYILGLRQNDELKDDLDASELGSAVHKTLELIYRPTIGSPLRADYLHRALADLQTHLSLAFSELYSHGRPTEGRNRLVYSVAEAQVRHFLRKEAAFLEQGNKVEILALEEDVSMPLREGVDLHGVIDRVDRCNGRIRVTDYKTGSLKDSDICVKQSNLTPDGKLPHKWIQLMCYALLYTHRFPLSEPLHAGIFPLRYLRSDLHLATIDSNPDISPSAISHFRALLMPIVDSLLDPSLPFLANPSSDACRFCPAASFCPDAIVYNLD